MEYKRTCFVKKKIVVEGWLIPEMKLGDKIIAPDWIDKAFQTGELRGTAVAGSDHLHITIKTLEGDMLAAPNDTIIQGIDGELYSCEETIFNDTYELIDEEPTFLVNKRNNNPIK